MYIAPVGEKQTGERLLHLEELCKERKEPKQHRRSLPKLTPPAAKPGKPVLCGLSVALATCLSVWLSKVFSERFPRHTPLVWIEYSAKINSRCILLASGYKVVLPIPSIRAANSLSPLASVTARRMACRSSSLN